MSLLPCTCTVLEYMYTLRRYRPCSQLHNRVFTCVYGKEVSISFALYYVVCIPSSVQVLGAHGTVVSDDPLLSSATCGVAPSKLENLSLVIVLDPR